MHQTFEAKTGHFPTLVLPVGAQNVNSIFLSVNMPYLEVTFVVDQNTTLVRKEVIHATNKVNHLPTSKLLQNSENLKASLVHLLLVHSGPN